MMKALVIDDEFYVRKEIEDLLVTHFKGLISIKGQAESVQQGLLLIETIKPDIVFLDIQLIDGTGFDLIAQTVFKNFQLIFITAFNHHAIQAIKVGALDYILKPIDRNEFVQAVNKAINNIGVPSNNQKLVEIVNDHYTGKEKTRLVLRTSKTLYIVYQDDIVYCKSDGNYTIFHTVDAKKIMVTQPLAKMQEVLPKLKFIRCHHSFVVNKYHVKRYDKKGILTMIGDIQVPVSGRKLKEVMQHIFHK
ncbi:MAG: LytTR family DNA-binding domain-containing protein [Bacteroidota bacterium]